MWNFKRDFLLASSVLWMAGSLASAAPGLGSASAVSRAPVCATCNEQAKRGATISTPGLDVTGLLNRMQSAQSSALGLGKAPKPQEGVKYLTGQSELPNALAPQPIPNLNEMEVTFTTPYYSNVDGILDSPEAPWNRVFPPSLAAAFNDMALGNRSLMSIGLATPSVSGLRRPVGATFSNPGLIFI